MLDTESETSSPVTKLHREQATELRPPTSLSKSSGPPTVPPGPGRPRDDDVTESWRQPRDLDEVPDNVPYASELLDVGEMSKSSPPLNCATDSKVRRLSYSSIL